IKAKSAQLYSFGGKQGDTSIKSTSTGKNGVIFISGTTESQDDLPKQVTPKILIKSNGPTTYIAAFSKDLNDILSLSVLPEEIITPQKILVSRSGDVYLGGKTTNPSAIENLSDFISEKKGGQWNGNAVIIKLKNDLKAIEWIIKAGPNMENISDMAETKDGILYTGGTSVKGAAMYVLKVNEKGKNIEFLKGKKTDKGYEKSWAIYLNEGNTELKEKYYSFYRKGGKDGFDYDGTTGKYGLVKFWDISPRVGGQIVVLPDNDFIVSAGVYFKFKEGNNKSFPAFNLLLARFSNEGELRWATNLYQEGDSVHIPDEKPRAMTYDGKTDSIFIVASQHGSNVYRLKGKLLGDTGNMLISWVGKVDAKNGALKDGWFFMNNRHPDENGKGGYNEDGTPRPAPHPKLAGNSLISIVVGDDGNVYIAGKAAARAWTSKDAFEKWPENKAGGGLPCLLILNNDLTKYIFASVFGAEENADGEFSSFILENNKIYLFGSLKGKDTKITKDKKWSEYEISDFSKAFIVQVNKQ
ncbi:MAG TPA: hypothetical protein P5239_04925, partial [Victivallales bacterium]|nr:hypothetical protein [Victivallales bacterium]